MNEIVICKENIHLQCVYTIDGLCTLKRLLGASTKNDYIIIDKQLFYFVYFSIYRYSSEF